MKRGVSVLLAVLLVPTLVVSAIGCGNDGTAAVPTLSLWTGDETVLILDGEVAGSEDRADTWVWKAIPYARPPVGLLRWKAPVDPDPWADVREETEYCSECPQLDIGLSVVGAEDCLYLNVWRPQSDETELPVYFWIHGGGNSLGSASDETYNGARIAGRSDMVVVSTNYRLGPLGWFAHPSLRSGDAGSEADDSGNFGTLDLIQALEWVRDNIEAFGGDPDNVTVAGESAGAINVLSLMISPPADDLFHQAIIQSGIPITNPVSVGEQSARDVTLKLLVEDGTAVDEVDAEVRLAAMAGDEVESYLRAKTPAELLAGYESASFGMISFPFIFEDGAVIPETGFQTLERGTYPVRVPVIIGSNKYETKVFLFMDPQFAGKDDLYQAVTAYTSDMWKVMGVDSVARILSSHDDQPEVFVYQFLWGAAAQAGEGVIPDPWGFRLGAGHGLDIPFFFGSDEFFGPLSPLVFTEQNRAGRVALSDLMMGYAAQFARTGNPNRPESSFSWSPWSNEVQGAKLLLLDAGLESTEIAMSGVELTESDVKATVTPEVLDLLESESLGFLTELVERDWLEPSAP